MLVPPPTSSPPLPQPLVTAKSPVHFAQITQAEAAVPAGRTFTGLPVPIPASRQLDSLPFTPHPGEPLGARERWGSRSFPAPPLNLS